MSSPKSSPSSYCHGRTSHTKRRTRFSPSFSFNPNERKKSQAKPFLFNPNGRKRPPLFNPNDKFNYICSLSQAVHARQLRKLQRQKQFHENSLKRIQEQIHEQVEFPALLASFWPEKEMNTTFPLFLRKVIALSAKNRKFVDRVATILANTHHRESLKRLFLVTFLVELIKREKNAIDDDVSGKELGSPMERKVRKLVKDFQKNQKTIKVVEPSSDPVSDFPETPDEVTDEICNDDRSTEVESNQEPIVGKISKGLVPEITSGESFPKLCTTFLNGKRFEALLDSGNLIGNVINISAARKLGLQAEDIEIIEDLKEIRTAKAGASLQVLGIVKKPLKLSFGATPYEFETRPMVCRGLNMQFNISGPYMREIGLDQLHSKNAISVAGMEIPLIRKYGQSGIYIDEDQEIPPRSCCYVLATIPEVEVGRLKAGSGLSLAHDSFAQETDLLPIPNSFVHVQDTGKINVCVLNTDDKPITLKARQRFGTYCPDYEIVDQDPKSALNHLGKGKRQKRDRAKVRAAFRLNDSPILQANPQLATRVEEFLCDYEDIISYNEEYGQTDLVEHEIKTGDAAPIKLKDRPMNPHLNENLKEQLNHWLEQGVIEPSTSPWSFPLLPVVKKKKIEDVQDGNGESKTAKLNVRWCVDFRKLNEMTKKDSYPLPNIEDNLNQLSKSRVFTTLDNCGAFHSVKIKKEDREKTAFSAGPYGLFQFRRMAFGLTNAPACYSRLIRLVLQGISPSVALIFLDDVIVHSASACQHLTNLQAIFEAYRTAGLRIKPSKCYLFRETVDYLGHRVSSRGIEVLPEYTQVVKDWPEPHNLKTLRAFLGKVSYYRRFIQDYAAIASPLTDILSKEHPLHKEKQFQLPTAAKEAFEDLKTRLMQAPILGYPKFDLDSPFILDTDWSGDPGAIGGVLSQKQDGKERVLMYGARKLNAAEKQYSSNKGELLALLHFMNKWRYYLQHRPFIVRTDHEALKWIKTMQEPRGMIARWLDTLSNFEFKVEYRPGEKHGNADALSRIEHAAPISENDPKIQDEIAAMNTETEKDREPTVQRLLPSWKDEDLKTAQEGDDVLGEVRKWVAEGKKPSEEQLRPLPRDAHTYYSLFGQLRINEKNHLVRVPTRFEMLEKERFCVPNQLLQPLVKQYHEIGGHMGISTTMHRLQPFYYAPNLIKEVEVVIRNCLVCQKKSGATKPQRHTLRSVIDGYPFQRLSIDLVGPLNESTNGNNFLFTCKDTYTRWIEAIPTQDITAEGIVNLLRSHIFSRYGMPTSIHSDNGRQFTAELMKELQAALRIHCTTTPAYNPKSNPVERSHRDIKSVLKALIADNPNEDWEFHLPAALLALRTARNRHTGFTPHFLLFGREAVLPVDLVYGDPPGPTGTPEVYVDLLRKTQQKAFSVVRDNLQAAHERAKQMYYDLDNRPLQETDLVWLFTPNLNRGQGKFACKWAGPFEIIHCHNPALFTIQSRWNQSKRVTLTVGIDRLKRYEGEVTTQEELSGRDLQTRDEFMESSGTEDMHAKPKNQTITVQFSDDAPEMVDILPRAEPKPPSPIPLVVSTPKPSVTPPLPDEPTLEWEQDPEMKEKASFEEVGATATNEEPMSRDLEIEGRGEKRMHDVTSSTLAQAEVSRPPDTHRYTLRPRTKKLRASY